VLTDNEAKHGVPEELEPLVRALVGDLGGEGAVGECEP
jgi:hypothetical protein